MSFAAKESAKSRGYGQAHKRERERVRREVEAGLALCSICGLPIDASEAFHLDHTPSRDGYRGAAHVSCNVRDGARRGAMLR